MPTNKATIRGVSAAVIGQCTVNSAGEITAPPSSTIAFDYVTEHGISAPQPESATSTQEFIEVLMANGTTVRYNKKSRIIDGVSGDDVSTGSSGGEGDKVKFTFADVGKTTLNALLGLRGKTVYAGVPIGDNVTAGEEGFQYVAGSITSAIEYTAKGEEVSLIAVEVTGKKITKASSVVDSALVWAPGEVLPADGESGTDEIEFTALVAGDIPTLLKGQLVIK